MAAKKKEEVPSQGIHIGDAKHVVINQNSNNNNSVNHSNNKDSFNSNNTQNVNSKRNSSKWLMKIIIGTIAAILGYLAYSYIDKNFSGDGHIPGSVKTPIPSQSR